MSYMEEEPTFGNTKLASSDEIAFNHPAIFPEKLAYDHIYSWSNEGDIVYDPFVGSGTTVVMADILKRNWFGTDVSAEYIKIAKKRLKNSKQIAKQLPLM